MEREGLHHLFRFIDPQQPRIDEDADELIADRLVDERRGHRRIDAAREPEDHFVAADVGANAGHGFLRIPGHRPVALAGADVAHESLEDRGSLPRVRDFGMELHAVEAPRFIHHRCDRRRRVARHHGEARGERRHLVAVAHPHVEETMPFGAGAILDT